MPEQYPYQSEFLDADEYQIKEQQTLRERIFSSRLGRAAIGGIASIGLAFGGVVTAEPAHAEQGIAYSVTGTDGEGVWLHSDPGTGDQADLLKIMPEGTQFVADCYVNDSPVGPRNNPVWLHGKDSTGLEGYFSDFYSNSRWDSSNTLEQQGLPICGQDSQSTSEPRGLQGHEAEPQFTGTYDRERAVSWALTNSQMQPPADGSCTWFVSNVLWQGGLPKTKEWTSEGFLGRDLPILGDVSKEFPGTYAAWNVNAFRDYMLNVYPESDWGQLDFIGNKVPIAERGDIIFYDWGKGEGISHAAVVTNIAEGQYPEVSEWSAGSDGSEPLNYAKRGWTRSEVSNKWLQEKYPHVKAYILHIDTANMRLDP